MAIIDTGSSFMAAPPDIYQKLIEAINEQLTQGQFPGHFDCS